jgi:hypothetical protein
MGFEFPRIGQDRGNRRRLRPGKVFGTGVEIETRSRFGAINPVTHLDAVEIHFEYPFLAPDNFDKNGKIDLKAFANPAPGRPEKDIFGGLLGDSAGTAQGLAALLRSIERISDSLEIEAEVIDKILIFAADNGQHQIAGDRVERDPMMLPDRFFACVKLFDAANQHERRKRNGDEPKEDYAKKRQADQADCRFGQESTDCFSRPGFVATALHGGGMSVCVTMMPIRIDATSLLCLLIGVRLFHSVSRLGQNLQIKRLKLLCYGFIDAFIDLSEVNPFGLFDNVAEFAIEIPEIDPFRQLFIALSLYVFFDIVSNSFYESVLSDFRIRQFKCFLHMYP